MVLQPANKTGEDRIGKRKADAGARFGFVWAHQDRLTRDLFKKFSDFVYDKTGIYLKSDKQELLKARLGKRLRATGINSFHEYYKYLVNDRKGTELVEFINAVSTNFTSFFRENAHFEFLINNVLPDFIKQGRGVREDIVFWSSACSSGQEPYTLAIVLDDLQARQVAGIRYRIMATDISTKVLKIAARGVYSSEQLDKIPVQYAKKYFQKGVGHNAGFIKVKEALRKKISFEYFNLMGDFPWDGSIDIIFCRNVMIYFDRKTQQKLVDKYYHSLNMGGYLFVGHSESLSGLTHKFKQVAGMAYQK